MSKRCLMLVSVAVLALTRLSMAALEADLQATASDLVDMEGSLSPLEARLDAHETRANARDVEMNDLEKKVTGDADDGVVVQTLFETMKERAEGTDSLATALFQLKDRVEALESRQTSFNSNSTLGWKQCEIQPLNNGCENCQIASCPFKKTRYDSSLKISWYGTLRVICASGCQAFWDLKIDGADCSTPGSLTTAMHDTYYSDTHKPMFITGYCSGTWGIQIPSGDHTITFHARSGYNSPDTYTSWGANSRIVIEEVLQN